MGNRRPERLGGLLLAEISRLRAQVINDPRIAGITFTNVRVSRDLKYARVFYSVLGDEIRQKQAMLGLESAKGLIKREVAKHLRLRYMPEIEFAFDDSLSYADHIQKLLKELHEPGE